MLCLAHRSTHILWLSVHPVRTLGQTHVRCALEWPCYKGPRDHVLQQRPSRSAPWSTNATRSSNRNHSGVCVHSACHASARARAA